MPEKPFFFLIFGVKKFFRFFPHFLWAHVCWGDFCDFSPKMTKKKSPKFTDNVTFFSTSQKSKKKKSKKFFDPQKIIFLSFLNHFEAKKIFSIFFFRIFGQLKKKVTYFEFELFFFIYFGGKWQKFHIRNRSHMGSEPKKKNFFLLKMPEKPFFF